MENIPHSKPWITEQDISKVAGVLRSSMIAQGGIARLLERRLAKWFSLTDGVCVGSGSAAIVLALYGIGIKADDEVILPSYVCRSLLEAVLTLGAKPVLCDVGPDWVITASDASKVLTPKTRAVVVPHLYGVFAEIKKFKALGVSIIEDCTQALDSDGKVSTQADVTVMSFNPTKCITSGEGGIVLSSNTEIIARMRIYRDGSMGHGTVLVPRLFSPLSDVSAALALSQLDRYEAGLIRRRDISSKYVSVIQSYFPEAINYVALSRSMVFRFPLHLPGGLEASQASFNKFGVQVRRGVDELLHRLLGLSDVQFPNATLHFNHTVSIPIYPALTENEVRRCIDAIEHVLSKLQSPKRELV